MRFWAELGILADTAQFVSVWRLIWRGRQSSYPKIFKIKILPTTINLDSNSNIITPIISPIYHITLNLGTTTTSNDSRIFAQFYKHSRTYTNVVPSEPSASVADAGRIVFTDESHATCGGWG